jgi:hypothetical protein
MNSVPEQPTIIITGSPPWAGSVSEQLTSTGWRVKQITERSRYVSSVVDDRAALILVDATSPEWQFWVVTPKASPATRRIPVVLVGTRSALPADASLSGADQFIDAEALLASASAFVSETARLSDDQARRQLESQCAEPMPAEGLLAIALFNAGEYYQQHDRFEQLWMSETGSVRELYRAILQVGIAYYQVRRGNLRGARKMLLRASPWLSLLPARCQGVDIAQLRRDADAVRAEIERVGEGGASRFDLSLLKGVVMISASPNNDDQ